MLVTSERIEANSTTAVFETVPWAWAFRAIFVESAVGRRLIATGGFIGLVVCGTYGIVLH